MAAKIKKTADGYNYKFADMGKVHEYLEKSNIDYYQYIERVDGDDYIMTVPIVDGEELPARRGCRVVMASLNGKSNPAQEQGSAITYARRYSLFMCFGLCAVDDDGMACDVPQEEERTELLKVIDKLMEETGVTIEKIKETYGGEPKQFNNASLKVIIRKLEKSKK